MKSKSEEKTSMQVDKIINVLKNYLNLLEELKELKARNDYEDKLNNVFYPPGANIQIISENQQSLLNNQTYSDNKDVYTYSNHGGVINTPYNLPKDQRFSSNNILLPVERYTNKNLNFFNPINTTLKKAITRMSTIQPQVDYNQLQMQPLAAQQVPTGYRHSKLNTNIIKNITKKSSLVLNTLGFGIKKQLYDNISNNNPSPNSCPYCNSSNQNPCKPFEIGTAEESCEKPGIKYVNDYNINNNSNNNNNPAAAKTIDKNHLHLNNFNLGLQTNKGISNKSVDKELLITNSSANTNTFNITNNHSKNVSFNLPGNSEATNNNNNNKNYYNTNTCDIANSKNPNVKLKEYTSNITRANYNNFLASENKKIKDESKLESDCSLDLQKNYTPDNYNKDAKNPNNLNTRKTSDAKQLSNSNGNSNSNNPSKFGFKKYSTLAKVEYNEMEIANIKSKWEALKQSVISTTSNNLRTLKDENLTELKYAKNEAILYKSYFENISENHKNLKKSYENLTKIKTQESETFKAVKESEILKFARALEIYHELYNEQLIIKDFKISQLSTLVDCLAENINNANLSVENNYNPSNFSRFLFIYLFIFSP